MQDEYDGNCVNPVNINININLLGAIGISLIVSLVVAAYQADFERGLSGERRCLPYSDNVGKWEMHLYDLQLQSRGKVPTRPLTMPRGERVHRARLLKAGYRGAFRHMDDIVIVAIDDQSIRGMRQNGLTYPHMPRAVYAEVLRNLKRFGAKVVAFDIVFSMPSAFGKEKEDDAEFAKAIREFGSVVLAAWLSSELSTRQEVAGGYLVQYEGPEEMLSDAAAGVGLVDDLPDPNDHSRRLAPLIGFHADNAIPSLWVQAVALYVGLNPEKVKVMADLQRGVFAGRRIPTMTYCAERYEQDRIRVKGKTYEAALINYAGLARTFLHVPIEEVLFPSLSESDLREIFGGKLVFIGDTSVMGKDTFPTPFDQAMPGVEIHANAAQNLLSGSFIRRTPSKVGALIVILGGLLAGVLTYFLRPLRAAIVLGVGTVLFSFIIFQSFAIFHQWVLTSYPLLSLFFNFVAITAHLQATVERHARHMKERFGRFAAPSVLKIIIERPDEALLKPEKTVATLMFTDLQGFTALSETRTPEQVVQILNEHFERMVEILQDRHGATIDKYMGDAIMAIFGAPLPQPDHAIQAVRAAVEMQIAMEDVRHFLRDMGLPETFMRIGIHTGEVVVGSVGAKRRLDFTAIGDTVNIASRLEGMNKQTNSWILISESTYRQAKDVVVAESVGEVAIRGRERPMTVYKVVGLTTGERIPDIVAKEEEKEEKEEEKEEKKELVAAEA